MKDIFIICSGASLKSLEDNVGLFKDKDILWVSINSFVHKEKIILNKINKNFDGLYHSDWDIFDFHFEARKDFIGRDENNFFITNYKYWNKLVEHGTNYPRKGSVVLSSYATGEGEYCKNAGYNSPMACLLSLISLGHRRFFMFGMDGHGEYYHLEQENRLIHPEEWHAKGLIEDTNIVNDFFDKELRMITQDEVEIFNVNVESKVEVFNKISLLECVEMIK